MSKKHKHEAGHKHTHSHSHHHSSKNIGFAFFLNATFTIIEVIGGLYTGSIAILSDALHDFGDSLSLGLAYFLEKKSEKGSNARFSYGYKRLSLLSALITGGVLILGSVVILWNAIPRLFNPTQPDTKGMLVLAVLGVLVNGFAALKVNHGKSMNERMITWHLLEDVLGWVAVLIISVVMMFWDLPILDPLLSIFFTCFIVFNVIKAFKATTDVFLQAVPSSVDLQEIRKMFLQVKGVLDVHDLHFWSLDGEHHVLTMHAVVEASITMTQAEDVKNQLRAIAGNLSLTNTHLTIELESNMIDCPDMDCVSIT